MLNRQRAAAIFAVLLPVAAAAQTPAGDLRFPVLAKTEAFASQPQVVDVSFRFYFPVDEKRYLPVNEDVAAALSLPPLVASPHGMNVRVLSTTCKPEELTIEEGNATVVVSGGRIESRVEITPGDSVAQGTHQVTLYYPLIDLVVARTGGPSPGKAEVTIDVEVWPSAAAKEAVLRAEQEKRRREAAAQEQANLEEAARQAAQARAAEEALAQHRIQLVRQSLPYLGVALLAVIILILNRKWLFPDLSVSLGRGEHVQQHLKVRAGEEGQDADAGTILQTTWGRSWIGRRKRIKVETFVSEDAQLDLLVSVGSSVEPGRYLARARDKSVRVIVTEGRVAA